MNRLARLTRIHQQRLRSVELAELAHATSLNEVQRAKTVVQQAEEQWNVLAESPQHGSVLDFEEGRERLAYAQRAWRNAEIALGRSNAKKDTTQAAVVGTTVEAKKLETLCDSTASMMREQADRIEALAFDELAARRARK